MTRRLLWSALLALALPSFAEPPSLRPAISNPEVRFIAPEREDGSTFALVVTAKATGPGANARGTTGRNTSELSDAIEVQ